ncbi:MFS transporter SIT family siderophore-iron:H+ symporter [Venturia nashicola]|uniref:MFS transporter n=1 Tax=Venturia nashicola TaxID=86259 RepID=A0A4Z1NUU8_9PEZI|nr:MFS transporter [Venturia nashicola]TLD31714.1 MFS transporter SIT family siderophore-iron:H+ symporter [Venturia nashicola]
MGFFHNLKSHRAGGHVDEPTSTVNELEKENYGHSHDGQYEIDSDTLSLEARNEKEVELNPDHVTANAQMGQQKAEAAALVWPKWAVYCTYGWIWICFFMLALEQGSTTQLNAAAYVDFLAAPELTTANILASIIGGVLKLPIAKMLNIWGRAEGFLVFVCVYILGMIILAASNGPSSYAAGYVLYWIGYYAIYLIMDIFVADTSGLKNRAFAFAFVSTPFIATAFTAPLLGAAFIKGPGWRWGYGSFTIIMLAIFMPLVIVFKFYQRKAEKMGLYKRVSSGRTFFQSVVHYFHEFDAIGCLLLMAAFILFLLPFSLNTYGKAQYSSASFIAMVVIGVLLFPVFAIWEAYFARVQFIRWELFRQRTVLGACGLAMIIYFSFYSWDLYFYNFVLVAYDLDVKYAGYMVQIYNVGSCFWGVVFGIWIRVTKHFKYGCLFFGLPMMFLGAGLMIHFRSADYGIGYLVMCQVFIAIGGGTLVIGEDMAVMAAADREGVPMMLSLIGLSSSVGGSIGYAVSAAIYSNTFPQRLQALLPMEAKSNYTSIYVGGYSVQKTYPVGSPIRKAIDSAWGESQKYGSVSATCILVLAIPAIAIWKNYNVDKKQNKGTMI